MGKIVDFSHHNGEINWEAASRELDLAIIRVQYGSTKEDSHYKEYIKGCKMYEIPFAHYAYALFVSINDAIVEARDFMNRVDPEAKFLVVDVEEETTRNPNNMALATQAFIDECRKEGWKIGLYTGHHFYHPYNMGSVDADFLWIPRYGEKKPSIPCDIWQYTDKGTLAGVSGNVDLNYLNGNKGLNWFIGDSSL
ncbi:MULTISPECIES: glycoside hydrolase family 25 protein [Bacillus]|uniref:glycoside hydrolase family 25 protein n=1 Tax=Bacillus TaxID=1386 RepID=UPI001574763F|nr:MULTISPECIES: glycoside hydrolase family 25 protein [Bacillus]MBC6975085.1 hypothetical protein [Bacillus sp. Xin]MBY0600116.1 glycoside hydrolase family 25 protein [Bacillus bingmayongensis]NSW38414.1 hypothetical protein [Bacillus sp. Xin1]